MYRQWKWFWLICMLASMNTIAQGKNRKKKNSAAIINNERKEVSVMQTAARDTVFEIKLYSEPNYRGRTGYFIKVGNRIEVPFSLANASARVSRGKIAYIRSFNEFPYELIFISSRPQVQLSEVTGVRWDDLTAVEIEFDGISTTVHDEDCKRLYGQIKVKVMETSPGASPVTVNMPRSARGVIPPAPAQNVSFLQDFYLLFNKTYAEFDFRNPFYAESYYVFDGPPGNLVDYPRKHYNQGLHNTFEVHAPGHVYFYVGKNALWEGRVKLLVETNLSSAHKSCGTCDDFTSSIAMLQPAHEMVQLNRFRPGTTVVATEWKKISFGPYPATGIREGTALTATSRINKNFSTYFKLRFFN